MTKSGTRTGTDAARAAVERAWSLVERDWAAAIDLLRDENERNRSPEIDIALVAIRHRGAQELAAAGAPASPAEPASAAPVGRSGLPETDVASLTAGVLRASIASRGSLLVRRAIDSERAKSIAESIDRSFAAQELADRSEHEQSAWWHPLELDPAAAKRLGRKWVRGGGGVLMVDCPPLAYEVLELYSSLGLQSVVSEYLGSRPVLSAAKSTLRRVSLDTTGGWHQDGAFLGDGIGAINLWLALTPCGVDAPGIDVVAHSFDHIVETGTEGSYFDWAAGSSVVEGEAGTGGIVRPEFEAGDLVMFNEMMLHRTAVEPSMTKERHAIEMWCFAPSSYPEGHVPVVW